MSSTAEELAEQAPRPWFKRPVTWLVALVLLLIGWLVFQGGVQEHAGGSIGAGGATGPQHSQQLLASAIALLRELGQSDSQQMSQQLTDRFNQWLATQPVDLTWTPDPLVSTLPQELRDSVISAEQESTTLLPMDDEYLQQCLWLRSISQRVSNQARKDLAPRERFLDRPHGDVLLQVSALLDWTTRNIQLVDEPEEGEIKDPALHPLLLGQSLIIGRGDALRRGWCLVMLARQQNLDMAMLALGDPAEPDKLRPWLPALLQDGQLYLFDPWLGLPIPGPEGAGVATLEQAAADDSLLRQLDLDAEHPYPIKQADLSRVSALIVASPEALSRRMRTIEGQLSGEDRLVLTTAAAAQAERFAGCRHVAAARLWRLPFEAVAFQRRLATLSRQPREVQEAEEKALAGLRGLFRPYDTMGTLSAARVLHLMGNFTGAHEEAGEKSANSLYQLSRPADGQVGAWADQMTTRKLKQAQVPIQLRDQVAQKFRAEILVELKIARQHASYFLGLAACERGEHQIAADYFQKRTLDASPDGPWTDGARFNLGQCYEALGQPEKALAFYEADTSPQRHGSQLRARRLRLAAAAAPATTP